MRLLRGSPQALALLALASLALGACASGAPSGRGTGVGAGQSATQSAAPEPAATPSEATPTTQPPSAHPSPAAPSPAPASSAQLPGAIVGVMPEGHGHIGPHVDSRGNVYTVVEDFLANRNRPKAMKSADGGRTWREVDAAGRTTTGDLEGDWTLQVGTRIYFAFQKSSGPIYFTGFNTSDATTAPDTWAVKREEIHSTTTRPKDQYVTLAAGAKGDIWAFYSTEPGRHTHAVGYKRRSAATGLWGAQSLLDPGRSVSQVVAVGGADGTVHVFYKDHAAQQVLYRRLDAAGRLGPATRVDRTGTHEIHSPMTNAVLTGTGAHERAVVAWADANGRIQAADVDAAGRVSPEQPASDQPVVIDPGDTTNIGAVAHLAVDGPVVHLLYADEATQDIWHDRRVGNGPWGQDAGVVANISAQWITGLNVYVNRSRAKVLAFVYDTGPHGDDGGIIRYDERPLSADSRVLPRRP